jgi:hypothetical protein
VGINQELEVSISLHLRVKIVPQLAKWGQLWSPWRQLPFGWKWELPCNWSRNAFQLKSEFSHSWRWELPYGLGWKLALFRRRDFSSLHVGSVHFSTLNWRWIRIPFHRRTPWTIMATFYFRLFFQVCFTWKGYWPDWSETTYKYYVFVLKVLKPTAIHQLYPGWTMRLYLDPSNLSSSSVSDLCELSCQTGGWVSEKNIRRS